MSRSGESISCTMLFAGEVSYWQFLDESDSRRIGRQFSVQLAHLDVVPASACTPRPSRSTTSSGGSAMHAAAYRSIGVALRGARPVTPSGSAEAATPARSTSQRERSANSSPRTGDAQQRLARAKRDVASEHDSHNREELS